MIEEADYSATNYLCRTIYNAITLYIIPHHSSATKTNKVSCDSAGIGQFHVQKFVLLRQKLAPSFWNCRQLICHKVSDIKQWTVITNNVIMDK